MHEPLQPSFQPHYFWRILRHMVHQSPLFTEELLIDSLIVLYSFYNINIDFVLRAVILGTESRHVTCWPLSYETKGISTVGFHGDLKPRDLLAPKLF